MLKSKRSPVGPRSKPPPQIYPTFVPDRQKVSYENQVLVVDKMSSTTIDPARAAESHTVQILAVTTVFHCLALLVVGLRSYTRIGILGSFGPQDVLMILATVRLPFPSINTRLFCHFLLDQEANGHEYHSFALCWGEQSPSIYRSHTGWDAISTRSTVLFS